MNGQSPRPLTSQKEHLPAIAKENCENASNAVVRLPRYRRTLVFLAFLCTACPHSSYASEDPVDGIKQLIAAGENISALEKIQEHLSSSQNSPELLLLEGIVHENLGDRDAAVKVYQTLISEYPDHPAPYNNLAVLHAYEDDFSRAIETLQSALGTNEDYRIAYENLTSIYEKLASDAYRKALDSDTPAMAISLTYIKGMKTGNTDRTDSPVQIASTDNNTDERADNEMTEDQHSPTPESDADLSMEPEGTDLSD